jgi:hypothetical protein
LDTDHGVLHWYYLLRIDNTNEGVPQGYGALDKHWECIILW